MYTLENVSTAKSYEALKRKGFSDADVLKFYSFSDVTDRTNFLISMTPKISIEPTRAICSNQLVGTQKCTVDIDSIRDMALEYMAKDFTYNGQIYNLNKYCWRFRFSTTKSALGRCISRRNSKQGVIELSQWGIENTNRTFDKWVNTMLHEIAHAIDVIIRGSSSHDWHWERIAIAIGCDGKRLASVEFDDLLSNPISKYTMVCPNGHTSPSHKKKASHSRTSCRRCNNAIGGKGFNSKFEMKQIQNY